MDSVKTRPPLTGHDDAPVVSYVQKLLEDAVALKASDLHFEPYEHQYRVRMRIDGELREVASPHMALKDRLASRIKVMSRLDIAEKTPAARRPHETAIGPRAGAGLACQHLAHLVW